MKKGLTAFVK